MCDCAECEQLLQPYLDRVLTEAEVLEAEEHLDHCSYCRRAYRFEEELRMYVRRAASEPMPLELKQKLAQLRISL
ncbi:MAG: zf-HC2 domain-containing protein [Thermoleophilia bacterium]|nr:zf-HC2 domain-containing protein [Thermoleophilia bacterium]